MDYMFYNCKSLTTIDGIGNWNVSAVRSYMCLFYGCNSLTEIDLSNWNTEKVTSIQSMFYDCKSLTKVKLSNWNISNISNMNYTFRGCSSLVELDLSNWNSIREAVLITETFKDCALLELANIDMTNCPENTVSKITEAHSNR